MKVQIAVMMTNKEARRLRRRKERIMKATRDIVVVITNAVFAISGMIFIINALMYDSTPYYKELAGMLILSVFASGIAAGIRTILCGR